MSKLILSPSKTRTHAHAHLYYVHNKYARIQKEPLETVEGVDYTNSIS